MDFSVLDKTQIHFIIGPGRSGTTLLAMIFNTHKEAIAAPEIMHFLYFYKKHKNINYISKEVIDDLENYFNIIKSSKHNNYFNTCFDDIFTDINIGDKVNYAQLTKYIYLSIYKTTKDINNISFIIDKNPFYTFHTEKIIDIFPEAKFITILRDYRSFVLSNRQSQNPYVAIKSLGYYCTAWNYHIDKLQKIKEKIKDTILIIKYEDFVLNKEIETKKVFDFLNMKYDKNVFNFNEVLKEKISKTVFSFKISERAKKTNIDLMKPINSERIESWKKEFKNSEIECIETLCGERGKLFNYNTTTHPNLIKKIYYKIASIKGYARVAIFYLLNSPKMHHYLNESRKVDFGKKTYILF
jgi:hypothetical protein